MALHAGPQGHGAGKPSKHPLTWWSEYMKSQEEFLLEREL